MKYLLSNGLSTDRVEYYIIDLFKLYLSVYPGDVPGLYDFGYNFNMNGIKKSDLVSEVRSRANKLVDKVRNNFRSGIDIGLVSCELIDETSARIVVSVGRVISEGIEINLYRS